MSNGRESIGQVQDPFVRKGASGALHMRRYAPLYVIAAVWLIGMAVFPTVKPKADGAGTDVAATGAGTVDTLSPDQAAVGPDGAAVGDSPTSVVDPASGVATTGTPRAPIPKGSNRSAAAGALVTPQTGKTVGGFDCKPGVRQIPITSYAVPCQPKFVGNNGGVTFRGVTKDKIRIVRRYFADTSNSRAADQIAQSAGYASSDVAKAVRLELTKYMNKTFELYGRQVEVVDYESENGNSTEEAQSRGREGACADATKIQKELGAFGVIGGSDPFSQCAAERQMFVFVGAAYFPERDYKKWHPYIWHTIQECERISYQVGEYIGKRLAGRKAKWAGDPVFQQSNRKFATYVPDNDGYQHCVRLSEKVLEEQYGQPKPVRYNYQLDLSRFPDQAAQAIVQFKAAGATTIVNACDPYSTLFMTQAATSQEYYPEWLIIGVAVQDADNTARLFDQKQVNGHLFGMSQLGATGKLIGPKSEPGKVYKQATGKEIPAGTDGSYFTLIHMFNLLSASGPNLNPANLGAGARTIPPGGAPDFPLGYWSLNDGPDGTKGAGDHTEVDDAREIYWVAESGTNTTPATKPRDTYYAGHDGNNGTYKETMGGKRFRNGEWPTEEPPVYPKR